MTINQAINKIQDVCMSYALDLEKESKQLIKATRKLRQFILDSVDDGK